MSFRDNLRKTLDFLGMEQKELAEKTGLSLKTIENYVKKDSSVPSADKAALIAAALGVTVEYLVSGKKAEMPVKQTAGKEAVNIISKLNTYNTEVITAMAKVLLDLQTAKKTPTK